MLLQLQFMLFSEHLLLLLILTKQELLLNLLSLLELQNINKYNLISSSDKQSCLTCSRFCCCCAPELGLELVAAEASTMTPSRGGGDLLLFVVTSVKVQAVIDLETLSNQSIYLNEEN